jgi:hypothetical protein
MSTPAVASKEAEKAGEVEVWGHDIDSSMRVKDGLENENGFSVVLVVPPRRLCKELLGTAPPWIENETGPVLRRGKYFSNTDIGKVSRTGWDQWR